MTELIYRALSCARLLCNRARELLERAALKALDVGLLEEIALHIHCRALFIYELEQLAFIARVSLSLSLSASSLFLSARCLFLSAGPHTLPAFSATSLVERQVSASASASTSSLATASARSSFGFVIIWTTSNF